jgi:hypothetical protein
MVRVEAAILSFMAMAVVILAFEQEANYVYDLLILQTLLYAIQKTVICSLRPSILLAHYGDY